MCLQTTKFLYKSHSKNLFVSVYIQVSIKTQSNYFDMLFDNSIDCIMKKKHLFICISNYIFFVHYENN